MFSLFRNSKSDSPEKAQSARAVWFGRFCRSRLAAAALIALCLTVYLPGFFSIPPVDRDESRFAQASRQMFESVALPEAQQTAGFHDGGLVVPKFQDKPRINKPPLIYWLQSASAAVFTGGDPLKDAIWMYRVPSLLAGIGTVLLVWFLGGSMFNRRVAFLGAAFLALSPIFVWEAHQARADQVLVFWTVLAQVGLWKVWGKAWRGESGGWGTGETPMPRGGDWVWAGVFWVALAFGVLTKGPITPLVCGLTVLTLCITTRRWRWVWGLKPIVGIVLAAAIVAPWVIAIGNHPLVGWARLIEIANDEVFSRSIEAKEGHWGPPGYHLLLLPVLLWPGSMMVGIAFPFAIRRVFNQNRARKEAAAGGPANSPAPTPTKDTKSKTSRFPYPIPLRSAELFCLAWIIPTWLVFEFVGTKLPHYTMPLYPAVAILCARTLLAVELGKVPAIRHWVVRIGLSLWLLLTLGLAVSVSIMFLSYGGSGWLARPPEWIVMIGYLLPFSVGATLLILGFAKEYFLVQLGTLLLAVLIFGLTLQWVMPYQRELWMSRDASWVLKKSLREQAMPIVSVEFHEPSLVFHMRGQIQLIDESDLPQWFSENLRGLFIVPSRLALENNTHNVLTLIHGFNYSNGQTQDIAVQRWQARGQ